ncbi:hypothetical protein [Pseudomonas sp. 58 R 12]|uniref:hypothetical protein n=1 Tax=Pseudomonas sp. 58 R 12 TaxID=1844107 RepID=UPI000811EDB9|nr:hypothetical protein [Pseudomonas sp. 58 R 12]CRM36135.1 hypothetical protein [Pseudomonas sp. 58 R 12]
MTQRTGNTSKRPSFADVKIAALKNIDRVLAQWLPNGKRVDGGKEYTAPNPLAPLVLRLQRIEVGHALGFGSMVGTLKYSSRYGVETRMIVSVERCPA